MLRARALMWYYNVQGRRSSRVWNHCTRGTRLFSFDTVQELYNIVSSSTECVGKMVICTVLLNSGEASLISDFSKGLA